MVRARRWGCPRRMRLDMPSALEGSWSSLPFCGRCASSDVSRSSDEGVLTVFAPGDLQSRSGRRGTLAGARPRGM